MAHPRENPSKKFTYADYLTWPEDERWEIIDGEAFAMTPMPSRLHSAVITRIVWSFREHFRRGPCEVHAGQLEVHFPKEGKKGSEDRDVVVPDILVVCDEGKLRDEGCFGAPDLIVEVLSPGSSSYDHITKKALYERNGVREYWLVHPIDRMVTVYDLGKDKVFGPARMYGAEGSFSSSVFPDLKMDLSEIFPPKPKVCRESPTRYGARKPNAGVPTRNAKSIKK